MQKCYDVRLCSTKDFPTLKELWKQTFTDSDAVINNFFENTVVPKNTVAVFDGHKAVSALYALECSGKINGIQLKAYYIYGISTLPEYRNQGLMRQTLSFAEAEARKRNADAIFLVPAEEELFSMYKKFGYETKLFYKETTIQRFRLTESYVTEKVTFEQYTKYRNDAETPLFSLCEKVFNSFLKTVGNGINCFSIENEGYLVYEKENETITIHELFGSKDVLLSELFKIENATSLVLREYSDNREVPYGMVKFLDNTDAENIFFGIPYGG